MADGPAEEEVADDAADQVQLGAGLNLLERRDDVQAQAANGLGERHQVGLEGTGHPGHLPITSVTRVSQSVTFVTKSVTPTARAAATPGMAQFDCSPR